ncbi:MAG: H/ACA ribonucleoprotein complex subunit GAR1 [Candidatus Ranarchaeia archaeon]
MKRLGKVSHLSNSNHLILRTNTKIKPQSPVLDSHLTQIGKIYDVFGPVSNPYVSIKPTIKNPEKFVGRILYLMN